MRHASARRWFSWSDEDPLLFEMVVWVLILSQFSSLLPFPCVDLESSESSGFCLCNLCFEVHGLLGMLVRNNELALTSSAVGVSGCFQELMVMSAPVLLACQLLFHIINLLLEGTTILPSRNAQSTWGSPST